MRRLEFSAETSAPVQSVWALLADFGGVENWAPGIRRSRLNGARRAGVGARRFIDHRWGFRIEEVVTAWNEGEGYTFELLQAPYPMCNVSESWQAVGRDGRTLISTTVTYDMRLGVAGAWLDAALVRHLVAREMLAGLEALVGRSTGDGAGAPG